MVWKLLSGLCIGAAAIAATNQQGWSVATARDDGRPLVVRYRTASPDGITRSEYSHLMTVTWRFKSESGMPSSDEKQRMNDLEDSLTNELEPSKQAFLTVVVTGNEVCEWQWYSRDNKDLMTHLNKALAGKPAFPIQIGHQSDPTWSAYDRFAERKSDGTPN